MIDWFPGKPLDTSSLASRLGKLEEVRYITVTKDFVDRVPRTLYQLSEEGRATVSTYRENMQQVVSLLVNPPGEK